VGFKKIKLKKIIIIIFIALFPLNFVVKQMGDHPQEDFSQIWL
jgi:hypothetical protein